MLAVNERQPRQAGVRPRYHVDTVTQQLVHMKMSPCNGCGSYAILLVIIQLAIIDSPVRAFAIPRTTNTVRESGDLTAEESSLLEVKNDFVRSDIKVLDSVKKDELLQKIIPVGEAIIEHETRNSALADDNIAIDRTGYITNIPVNESEKIVTETNGNREETTEPATFIDKEATNKFSISTNFTEEPDFPNSNTEDKKDVQKNVFLNDETTTKDAHITSTIEGHINTQDLEPSSTKLENAVNNDTLEMTTLESKVDTKIETDNVQTYPTASVKVNSTLQTDTYSNNGNNSNEYSTNLSTTELSSDINSWHLNMNKSKSEVTESTANKSEGSDITDTDIEKSLNTPPSWKKYTEIQRKHTIPTTIDVHDTVQEMSKADTIESNVKLEKPTEKSKDDISTVEKLKNNLISFFKNALPKATSESDISSSPSVASSSLSSLDMTLPIVTSLLPITAPTMMPVKVETTYGSTIDVVSSKRAGYLNYSAEPTMITETPTTASTTTKTLDLPQVKINATELSRVLVETENQDNYGQYNRNVSGGESQSQLREDAIKEELLKEEMLNDYAENSKRYHGEDLNIGSVVSVVNGTDNKSLLQSSQKTEQEENKADDKAIIKPVVNDKIKNALLYAVSPNYKPLKKIEVQSPKPFIRDPDDNSWRNESISSLGIVFKPKNSSKPFTQVLKNKTETLMNNLMDKYNKSELPELRERLEKIAEMRKSKKKKLDSNGETVYNDYEENAAVDGPGTPKPESNSAEVVPINKVPIQTVPPTQKPSFIDLITTTPTTITSKKGNVRKSKKFNFTTENAKKFYNILDYYDSTDDEKDNIDYSMVNKIDLKKFTIPLQSTDTPVTSIPFLTSYTKPMRHYLPDRKPTLQYFPPRVTQKNSFNEYDNSFQRKVNMFTLKDSSKIAPPTTLATESTYPSRDDLHQTKQIVNGPTDYTRLYKTDDLNRNLYFTHPPRVTVQSDGYEVMSQDTNFNRDPYVIKNYGDMIKAAVKDSDYDRNADYIPVYTEAPLRGVTITDLNKQKVKIKSTSDDYDYETQFHKDVLDKFVQNFNRNSERFKVDFPIVYNSSVVHKKTQEDGKVLAASNAFMKRLYNDPMPIKQNEYFQNTRPYDPNCENITVELSPAYELHYYVPEQEEKEEVESKTVTLPYGYRL